MRLSVKTILVTAVSLVTLATVLGSISVVDLRRASERHLEAYLRLAVDNYVDQYPHRLHDLLAAHGLSDVQSFVDAYQVEAMAAVVETRLQMQSSIHVIGETPQVAGPPGPQTASVPTEVLDQIGQAVTASGAPGGMIHRDSDRGYFFVYRVFEPWGWTIAAVAPDTWLRSESRAIVLRTFVTATLAVLVAMAVLVAVFRWFFVAPLHKIGALARSLALGDSLPIVEVDRSDELGALARDLTTTGRIISETQTRLTELNRDLEARVVERTAELAASVEAQKLLVREVHHRVKNNLSVVHALLEFEKNKVPQPVLPDALATIQSRISSMSLVHELLYSSDNLARADVSTYLESLIEQLQVSLSSEMRRIRITVEADPVPLSLDFALPCGLIVNELVWNAVKHAFGGRESGTVAVTFRRVDAGTISLAVTDDGDGYDVAAPTNSAGIGRQLVAALVSQLGGTLEISSAEGLKTTVTFPYSEVSASE